MFFSLVTLVSTTTLFKGIMWFLAMDLVVLWLLMVFPNIILHLPRVFK